MAKAVNVKALVGWMPELDVRKDKKGKTIPVGKLTGPPWPSAEEIYDAILAGGREALLGVIDMLAEVDDGKDYKARYALHGLAVYVCRKGKEKQRAALIGAIASQLGGGRPKPIQRFLVRQVQVAGNRRAAGALGRLLLDEDLCEPAVQALLAIDRAAATEALRRALPKAKGKCRLPIIHGLGVVRHPAAADALMQGVADQDREVRIAAVWGLANLGDAGAAPALMRAADASDGWERIQAAKACLLLAERLGAAGKSGEAGRLYKHLRDTRTEASERYVRDAAEKALAGAG